MEKLDVFGDTGTLGDGSFGLLDNLEIYKQMFIDRLDISSDNIKLILLDESRDVYVILNKPVDSLTFSDISEEIAQKMFDVDRYKLVYNMFTEGVF